MRTHDKITGTKYLKQGLFSGFIHRFHKKTPASVLVAGSEIAKVGCFIKS